MEDRGRHSRHWREAVGSSIFKVSLCSLVNSGDTIFSTLLVHCDLWCLLLCLDGRLTTFTSSAPDGASIIDHLHTQRLVFPVALQVCFFPRFPSLDLSLRTFPSIAILTKQVSNIVLRRSIISCRCWVRSSAT